MKADEIKKRQGIIQEAIAASKSAETAAQVSVMFWLSELCLQAAELNENLHGIRSNLEGRPIYATGSHGGIVVEPMQ